MTMLAHADVSIGHAGSVTTASASAVPEIATTQFRPAMTAVTTRPVPATGRHAVPASTVPRPTNSVTDVPEPYVTTNGWTAWIATEIDRGYGWETLTEGRVRINLGSQRELDEIVDERVGAVESGTGYGLVRVSAATVDNRGRALVAYSEVALPAAGRSNQAVAASATA